MVSLKQFEELYYDVYDDLYENDKSFVRSRKACAKFESLWHKDKAFTDFAIKFTEYRGDALMSDRELAAFYLAYQQKKGIEDKANEIFKQPYDAKKDIELQKLIENVAKSMKGKKTHAPQKKCPVKVNFRKML